MVQRRAGVQARRPTAAARRSRASSGAAAAGRSAPRPTTTLSLTYANESRRLHDLQRGARRSDVPRRADRARPRPATPEAASGHALGAHASTPAATRPTTCSTRKQGYVRDRRTSRQAGRWLGGDFDYYELTAEGRYYQVDRQPRGGGRAGARGLDRRARRSRTSWCRSSSATSSAARRTCAAGAASKCRR